MRLLWDIITVTVIHSVLTIAKAPIFYKTLPQSGSLGTQISGTDCRQCPSQGVWGAAAALQATRGGAQRGVATTNSIGKVRSHSFSVSAVSRLLFFALCTAPCTLAQWGILPESKVTVWAENTGSLWSLCIPCLVPALGLEVISQCTIENTQLGICPFLKDIQRSLLSWGRKKLLHFFLSPACRVTWSGILIASIGLNNSYN